MPFATIIRWSGVMAALGGLLLVFCEVMGILGPEGFHDTTITLAERITTIAFFSGAVFLTLGLPGAYLAHAQQAGRFGLAAYFTALAGSGMMIASDWSDLFVHPALVQFAEYAGETPGDMVVGFLMNYGIYTLGWLLVGIALLRARTAPRPLALLMIGGVLLPVFTIITGSIPGEFLPMYLAFAWFGVVTVGKARGEQAMLAESFAA